MTAHTPGPWTVEPSPFTGENSTAIVTDSRGEIVAEGLTDPDARLIAAAPDLLAALHRVLRVREASRRDGFWEIGSLTIETIEAAIAKATGQEVTP